MGRQPEGPPPPPTVQRLRIRYTKSGPLRFTSHRDFARAFERALRRAEVPMAYSAGFSPHPKISYAGAAPTGVSSNAEYLEIGLAEVRDPSQVRAALDAALPAGLDIAEVVVAADAKSALAERLQASRWQVDLPGVSPGEAADAVALLKTLGEAEVSRATKDGMRTFDVLPALIAIDCRSCDAPYAILELVVLHTVPAVRPDDVVTALREHASLSTPEPPAVTRLAQGQLPASGVVGQGAEQIHLLDPLANDLAAADAGVAQTVTPH